MDRLDASQSEFGGFISGIRHSAADRVPFGRILPMAAQSHPRYRSPRFDSQSPVAAVATSSAYVLLGNAAGRENRMPERKTAKKAQQDTEEGKSASTAAGEFVKEEFHHVREGKHGAKNSKQAIAIGLSKARQAGVPLPAPPQKEGTATKPKRPGKTRQKGQSTRASTSRGAQAAKRPEEKSRMSAAKKTPSRSAKSPTNSRKAPTNSRSRRTTGRSEKRAAA